MPILNNILPIFGRSRNHVIVWGPIFRIYATAVLLNPFMENEANYVFKPTSQTGSLVRFQTPLRNDLLYKAADRYIYAHTVNIYHLAIALFTTSFTIKCLVYS